MDPERLISELTRVLARRGLSVRSEQLWGVHPGGKCRLKGKEVVLLNTKAPPVERLIVLADCVVEQPLEEVDPSDELSIEARSLLQRRLARRSDLMAPAAASRPGLAKGSGTLRRLPDELSHLGVARALVLATPRQNDLVTAIRGMIGERFAGVFTGAVMHTPVEVTERAMEVVHGVRADCLVAVGGGSTTGLGKAIALRTDRFWPLWVAGLQLTTLVAHMLKAIKIDLLPHAYAAAGRFWVYPIFLIIVVGTWRSHQRRLHEQRAKAI